MDDIRLLRDDLGLSVIYRAPETEMQRQLCEIWRDVLQIDQIGIDDNFLELGGDSLAATTLALLVESRLDKKFSPADIISYSTVSEQSDYCDQQISDDSSSELLPSYVTGVNTLGGRPPLFLLHGANGFTLPENEFFSVLGTDQPVYLFQVPGLDGRNPVLTKIEDYARTYADVILKVQPEGSWRIAAPCAGTLIALELSSILEEAGGQVEKLILIDPPWIPKHLITNYPAVGEKAFIRNFQRFIIKMKNFMQGQGFVLNTDEATYRRILNKDSRRYKKRVEKLAEKRQDIATNTPVASDIVASYTPDRMLQASQALLKAYYNYLPRPWNGKAYMLVTSHERGGLSRTKNDPFWSRHLADIEYEVFDCAHGDIFHSKLPDLANYVSSVLTETVTINHGLPINKSPLPMNVNLLNALQAVAFRWPDRIAIDAPGERLTYHQLMIKASQFSNFLENKGVGPGNRVGIALSSNNDTLISILSLWVLGATALVVDFRCRASERNKIAGNAGLSFFIQDRPAPGSESYPALTILSVTQTVADFKSETIRTPVASGSDVAIIGVSSGTTGTPQAVSISHACLFARYAIARSSPQWEPGGCFLVTSPLAFSATRKHVLSRLLDGGTVVFTPLFFGANDIVSRVAETGVNSMLTVPSIARQLMELAPENTPLFPDMDWLMCCGAPMSPQEKIDARDRLCSGFVQNYGSTMAGMITLLETADIETHPESVGRPLLNVLVEVVDAEDNPLEVGEVGNIRVRTPGVADELQDVPGGSERSSDLVIHGWIYPGDMGMLDDDGFLYIVGRSSDIIIRAGVNVYPSEIEEVIAEHPFIIEAAVVGMPDKLVGEEIAAFVVSKSQVSSGELLAWCRSRLQPDKQPRYVFTIDEMPRNSNGKLLRRELLSLLPEC